MKSGYLFLAHSIHIRQRTPASWRVITQADDRPQCSDCYPSPSRWELQITAQVQRSPYHILGKIYMIDRRRKRNQSIIPPRGFRHPPFAFNLWLSFLPNLYIQFIFACTILNLLCSGKMDLHRLQFLSTSSLHVIIYLKCCLLIFDYYPFFLSHRSGISFLTKLNSNSLTLLQNYRWPSLSRILVATLPEFEKWN